MSYWNYRVIHKVMTGPRHSLDYLEIHEVYYDDLGTPHSISEKAIVPYGETPDELADDLKRMSEALTSPFLNIRISEVSTITKHSKVIRYVIEIRPGEYPTYVGGDWGPNHMPRRDIFKAVESLSESDARNYARQHWDSSEAIRVKIRKISIEETTVIEILE